MNINKFKIMLDFVGPKMPRSDYKRYIVGLKKFEANVNKSANTSFEFVPTVNRIVNYYGGSNEELLTTFQSHEFISRVYKLLQDKGYKLPKSSIFMEEFIPSYSGIGAINSGENMIYNPRSINRLTPRHIFHEIGHLMHEQMQKMSGFKLKILTKKDKLISFLSKEEKEIFVADIKRAYNEKHYRGIPFKHYVKDSLFCFGKIDNKAVKRYKQNAAERNSIYPLTDRFEFVADLFSLLIQGFKFSPEIMAKYEEFAGPKVNEIFTKLELDELLKLQKQIRKKTLKDYSSLFNN